MVDKREIDGPGAGRILALEESHYIDLKSVDIEPAKLSESVSAFANTAGGEIFVGVDEKDVGGRKTHE